MKSSVLLKWGLCFVIVTSYLLTQSIIISNAEEKPAVSKIQPGEKKQLSEAGDEPLPEIFIATKEYDGGAVYEGAVVTHSFIVKNKCKGELQIKSVKPG